MNKNIKNILLEYIDLNKYKKFKDTVYKYLDHELSESELERDETDYENKLIALPYMMSGDFNIEEIDADGILIEYLLDMGKNPLEYVTFDTLRVRYMGDDIVNLLENSGWFDKYMEDDDAFPQTFRDVEKKGDRFYLVVDRWDELSGLFKNNDRDFVERILSEDWAELYNYFEGDWDIDVVDNLNEKSIKHIKDYIKEGDFIGQEMSEYSMDDEHGHILTEDMVKLVPENFMELYDPARLAHIIRYLKAVSIRGERALVSLEKDQAKAGLINEHEEHLNSFLQGLSPGTTKEKRTKIEEFFWLIEEYKVSVFAQELKTVVPVSRKRLEKMIRKIERMV